ncbi:MAG: GNAT family N-acetyltransferase [Methylobacterium sp.]|jgi:N-acetylglutamate synthase-like GNAT family acetyltransferase|nr:GNAT family N-acetyltransferase [Methylobacterium sp.]
MAEIVVERTVGKAKKAVIAGLVAFNRRRMPASARYKSFAVTLRDNGEIVGGVTGECWTTVLFIQLLWIDERFRGGDFGTRLMAAIEEQARRFGARRAYVDTMSFQAPDFYRKCGYHEFGAIADYPDGVSRHWFTKALAPLPEKSVS